MSRASALPSVFFFNDTATTQIFPLSLHDALPISRRDKRSRGISRHHQAPPEPHGTPALTRERNGVVSNRRMPAASERSEEHTSELQSQSNLVCRLLLEKKKNLERWKAYA